jgi:hypothetical protein
VYIRDYLGRSPEEEQKDYIERGAYLHHIGCLWSPFYLNKIFFVSQNQWTMGFGIWGRFFPLGSSRTVSTVPQERVGGSQRKKKKKKKRPQQNPTVVIGGYLPDTS